MSGASEPRAKPLVTLALFSFNQERFIRAAVEAALAQTYSPLEIILSDDCSSDGTFEIMKEVVAAYTGPHQLVLNRNDPNIGIGAHICKISRMASGALVVGAAGDDLSTQDRVQKIVELWTREGMPNCSICSAMTTIDGAGQRVGKVTRSFGHVTPSLRSLHQFLGGKIAIPGASHAWSRNLIIQYDDFRPRSVNEDRILGLRAILEGGIYYLPEELVAYRVHSGNISMAQDARRWHRICQASINASRNNLDDLRRVYEVPDDSATRLIKGRIRSAYLRRHYWSKGAAARVAIALRTVLASSPKTVLHDLVHAVR